MKQHTTTDWNYSSSQWMLDTSKYVSPPSSIRGTVSTIRYATCKAEAVLCLPEGMVVNHHNFGYYVYSPRINFRNQAPVGQSSLANCYVVSFGETETYLQLIINNVAQTIGTFPFISPLNQWVKTRIKWWNGYDPQNVWSLYCSLEVWENNQWLAKGEPLIDPQNKWLDSEINRVGIGFNQYIWHDDMEIYGAD